MTLYRALLCIAMAPLPLVAQPNPADVNRLRTQAIADGSVDVSVTSHAVAATRSGVVPTADQRIAIQRAQHKILIQLISRGLVVGKEVSVAPDGSFTMRVLPAGLDHLAASADVAILEVGATQIETHP
jgi:hypothetical protein